MTKSRNYKIHTSNLTNNTTKKYVWIRIMLNKIETMNKIVTKKFIQESAEPLNTQRIKEELWLCTIEANLRNLLCKTLYRLFSLATEWRIVVWQLRGRDQIFLSKLLNVTSTHALIFKTPPPPAFSPPSPAPGRFQKTSAYVHQRQWGRHCHGLNSRETTSRGQTHTAPC